MNAPIIFATAVIYTQADEGLVLQLQFYVPAIVSAPRVFIMADAPMDPLPEQGSWFRPQEDRVRQQMADRGHRDAELRRPVQEAAARPTGLLSFRLPDGESLIAARNRSARSLARNAAAAITKLM